MVFYKNLESKSVGDILLHASNDVENWNEEERNSLRTIAEGVKKFKSLQKQWGNEMMNEQDEKKLFEIEKEQKKIPVSWWKLQGNQGMAYRENRKPFAFKVVGYDDHDGYFTPGVGVFEC